MGRTSFSGRVDSDNGFEINGPMPANIPTAGLAGSYAQANAVVSAIPDATATKVLQLQIPNANNSAVVRIFGRSTITAVGHIGDSTRVWEYQVVVTRLAGAVAVAAISAVIGGQIATKAGGSTLTSTLALAAVVGGATANNTIDIQVTNTGTPAGISETHVFAEILNYQGGPINTYPGAGATTGVTLST